MIELAFDRGLYEGKAVDEAVKGFAAFAKFELEERPAQWVVRLTSQSPRREQAVARELANHALGLTIQRRTQP